MVGILGTVPVSRETILADLRWNKEDLRRAILDVRREGYKVILRHISDGIAMEYYFYMDEASVKKGRKARQKAGGKEEANESEEQTEA